MTLLSATKRNNFHAFERTRIDILLRALRGKKKKGEKEKLKFSTSLASRLEKINTPADSKLPLIIHRIYRRYIFFRLKIRNLYPRISISFFSSHPKQEDRAKFGNRFTNSRMWLLAARRELPGMQNMAYRP